MHYSLADRTITLSVGEFAGFHLGPSDGGSGGPQGIWRAQLGQHWHNELQRRTQAESPHATFEVTINGRLTHRGWTFALAGRIDQVIDFRAGAPTPPPATVAGSGDPVLQEPGLLLREIKSVMRPLPADETALRTDYPDYFLQIGAYVVLQRTAGRKDVRAELVFVEAGAGLSQTIALTPFDEALVFHQLDAIAEFLNLQLRSAERRRHLVFQPPFPSLRPGQETIQQDLLSTLNSQRSTVLFEAPTGYGKTGCVLEFALGQIKSGRFDRLVWLTGKSTGQLQVMHTLRLMAAGGQSSGLEVKGSATRPLNSEPLTPNLTGTPVPAWQVRNKGEHCINHTFHCVRDGCSYLRDCAERWPGSGLSRFYTDERQPRDLDSLRAAGRAAQVCPYEITRAALPFNDVWIGDYNYVFAPDNRGLFFDRPGFDPARTLLVIDEAHNLPSRVAGAYSQSASDQAARQLLAELDHLGAPATLALAVEEWTRLLAALTPAESLDPPVEADIRDLVGRLANLVSTTALDYAMLGPGPSGVLWQFAAYQSFLDDTQLTKLLWVSRPGQLEFTCIDAAPAIGATLQQFGGALLMSATLQPHGEFAESCGLNTPRPAGTPLDRGDPIHRSEKSPLSRGVAQPVSNRPGDGRSDGVCFLQAPTPWRAGAYDVAVDTRVSTTYRDRANYFAATAATIVSLSEAAQPQVSGFRSQVSTTTPCVVVFFPSYAYAEAIEKTLRDYGSVLRLALQPKLPDLAAQMAWVEENLALSDALFLVLGSSFAEGIDLLGGRVSHAMVVGPALPEVNAVQKARTTALAELGREAAFRRVYQIPGLQKVNQALGRIVRAPGQKAKVLLHCKRFAEPSYAALLAADYQLYREIAAADDLADWLRSPQP